MDNRINDSLAERILDSCQCAVPVCEQEKKETCGGHTAWGLKNYPLGMVYAPIQAFDSLYDLDKALSSGTVFKELDLPFMGMSVTKGGSCRG